MTELLQVPTEQTLLAPVAEVLLLEPTGSDDLLEVPQEQVLLSMGTDSTLLEPVESLVLLTEALQGPPGPVGAQGEPGPVGDAEGALLVTNRLSEFASDPAAQAHAQQNIGLGAVDPLAYYILAKA